MWRLDVDERGALALARTAIEARRRLEEGVQGMDPDTAYRLGMSAFGRIEVADQYSLMAMRAKYDDP